MAEASGLSPAQCEFDSYQVYLYVEMAKMVDMVGLNPAGLAPSEFESRFPHLCRITRKEQRQYLGTSIGYINTAWEWLFMRP